MHSFWIQSYRLTWLGSRMCPSSRIYTLINSCCKDKSTLVGVAEFPGIIANTVLKGQRPSFLILCFKEYYGFLQELSIKFKKIAFSSWLCCYIYFIFNSRENLSSSVKLCTVCSMKTQKKITCIKPLPR